MFISLIQVLCAAIRTVSRSAFNIMLYSMLSRIFNKWLGFNSFISFFCSAYCISRIVGYLKRIWFNARIKSKRADEKISLDELTWQTPTTLNTEFVFDSNSLQKCDFRFVYRTNDKFENDWNYLIENEKNHTFSTIVDIPFQNGLLFFTTIMIIDYQVNHSEYNYITCLIRTMGILIVLICGSSVRYQTLYERQKTKLFDFMKKNREDFERYMIYSTTLNVPIASICLQRTNKSENTIFLIQFYQINSKFHDYIYDIENYICKQLIERCQIYSNDNNKPVSIIWSIPTCKQIWKFSMKHNKFVLRYSYKDFSFMPLVNSYIEQYEYKCLSNVNHIKEE